MKNNKLNREQYQEYFKDLIPRDTSQCPESDLLQEYVNKNLSKKKAREIEEHLNLCPYCVQAVQKLLSAEDINNIKQQFGENWTKIEKKLDTQFYTSLDSLKSARRDFPKISSWKRYFDLIKEKWQEFIHTFHPGKALAYAGSVAIILIMSIYSFAFFSRSDNFYLAEIEPEKQSTLRTGVDSASILTQGMRLFNQKNYAQAVKQFQIFLNENPEYYPANYYAGLSLLLSAKKGLPGLSYTYDQTKVSAGIVYLNQALQNSENNKFYREDCYWYLGKAFLMKGKASEARKFFQKIIQLSHPYLIRKAAAKEMLAKLN